MNIYDVNFAKVKDSFKKIVPEYECPINLIYDDVKTKMRQEQENFVVESVVTAGVKVDKDELIKALQYDRKQYEEGFEAGKSIGHNKAIDVLAELAVKSHDSVNYYYMLAMQEAMEIIKKAWLEEDDK